MKKLKLKNFCFLELIASVIISVLLSIWFSMHYMSHLYKLASIHSNSVMAINKRIDLLEEKNKDISLKEKETKPVML